MDETTLNEEQQENSKVPPQLRPHVFKKGQSGNPNGRPPGKTLKEYGREMLAAMTDEERDEFLQGIDKIKIWEMVEGKAEAKTSLDAVVEHKLPPEQQELINKALGDI